MINHKCIDYQGVLTFQVSLFDNALFGTVTYKLTKYSLFSSNEFHHLICTVSWQNPLTQFMSQPQQSPS